MPYQIITMLMETYYYLKPMEHETYANDSIKMKRDLFFFLLFLFAYNFYMHEPYVNAAKHGTL